MYIHKKLTLITPYVVLILFIFFGIFLSYEVHKSIEREIKHKINYLSHDMTNQVHLRMRSYEQVLKGLSGLYISNNYSVTRKHLLEYAAQLGIEYNLPGVQAVGFSSYVTDDSVKQHVTEAITDGYREYHFRTDKKKSGYVLVDIMYPDVEENRRVYGFDLTSEPIRAAMLDYALNTMNTGLSSKIVLKQEITDKNAPAGVLMSKPIFRNGSLFGFVSAPFRINDLMKGIFNGDTRMLVLKIYDKSVSEPNLLFCSDNYKSAVPGYSLELPLKMYGADWIFRYEATQEYLNQFDNLKPYMIMISMLTIGILLTVLIRNLLTARDRTYNMAKQIAEQLVESEHRFHQTFEQASVGIVITNLNLEIMSFNRSFRDILTSDNKELTNVNIISLLEGEDNTDLLDNINNLQIGAAERYITEKKMVSKINGSIWTEISVSVYFDTNTMPRYLIFIIQDISRRKQAEQKLMDLSMQQAAILNNSVSGIMKVKSRKVEWVNPAFEKLFGYSEYELKGKSTRILHPSESDFLKFGLEVDNIDKMTQVDFVQTQAEMLKKDGTPVWVDISGKLVESDAESSSIWVLNDVTERKNAQDELVDLNANLESKVVEETQRRIEQERLFMQQGRMAAMGEMIGAIAHQWRQPLNIVALVVQNICSDFEDGRLTVQEMNEYTENVLSQLKHMSATIDDFRNFFKIDKKNVSFVPCEQIYSVIQLVNAQMKANNININLVCGEKCYVDGVPNEFSQVILNLISNSKDAFLANRIQNPVIDISTECAGTEVVVKVNDNAGGISDGIADRVFDPYFTTKKKELGTGIGLYMSKMIITDHFGGTINFHNTDDGVEFVIKIPLASAL